MAEKQDKVRAVFEINREMVGADARFECQLINCALTGISNPGSAQLRRTLFYFLEKHPLSGPRRLPTRQAFKRGAETALMLSVRDFKGVVLFKVLKPEDIAGLINEARGKEPSQEISQKNKQ